MSSVMELESRTLELIDYLEKLDIERTDISVAIVNMRESLRKMLVEYSKDYPNEELLNAYKRVVEKDSIYGEFIASQYNNEWRETYATRIKVLNLADSYRRYVLSSQRKVDDSFIVVLANYQFLLRMNERVQHLLYSFSEDEERRLTHCENAINKRKVS